MGKLLSNNSGQGGGNVCRYKENGEGENDKANLVKCQQAGDWGERHTGVLCAMLATLFKFEITSE